MGVRFIATGAGAGTGKAWKAGQAAIWGKNPVAEGRFMRLDSGYTVEQNTADGCIISVPTSGMLYEDYWYPDMSAALAPVGGSFIVPIAGLTTINDGDFNSLTGGGVFQTNATAGGTANVTNILWPSYIYTGITDAQIIEIRNYIYLEMIMQGTAVDTDYEFGFKTSPAEIWGAGDAPVTPTYPDLRIIVIDTLATVAGITADEELHFKKKLTAGANDNASVRINEFYRGILVQPNIRLDLYVGWDGIPSDTWIDDRGTVDGYTVDHADNNTSGATMDNPITAIEGYLRNVIGLGDDQINMDTFNIASVTAPMDTDGFTASFAYATKIDTLDKLVELVKNFRCFMWMDTDDKVAIVVLQDDYTVAERVVDGDLISNLDYGRTDKRFLYTQFTTEYAGPDSLGIATEGPDSDATAQLWNNVTGDETDFVFEAIGYRVQRDDDFTPIAERMNDYFLANQKLIHNTAFGNLPAMYSDIQIGTILGFKNIPRTVRGEDLTVSYTLAGQTIRPFFVVIEMDHSNNNRFLAVQAHKLD